MPKQTIHAVLLMPAEGDPLGLLAEGPCGARPPLALQLDCERCGRVWCAADRDSRQVAFQEHRHHWSRIGLSGREACRWRGPWALVLAWDGEVVPEGVDRMYRSLRKNGHDWPDRLHYWASADEASHWCMQIQSLSTKFGTLVLLDADRNEVTRD